ERLGDRVAEAIEQHGPFPEEIEERLPEFVIFEGLTASLAEAVALRSCAPPASDPAALAREKERLPDVPAAPASVSGAEASFRIWARSRATRDALARELRTAQNDLVRIDLIEASFSTEDAAREALLCVREDQEPLEEAAKRVGGNVARVARRVEDFPRT